MSVQEHFHVFETILYSLALAHFLIGGSKMLEHRKKIRFYWVHTLASLTIFLMIVHRYFIAFDTPAFTLIKYAHEFLLVIVVPLSLIFVVSYLLIPNKIKNVDFKDFFWARANIYIGLLILIIAVLVYRNYWEFSAHYKEQIPLKTAFRAIVPQLTFIALGVVSLFVKNQKLWTFIVVLGFIFMSYLIADTTLGW
jgi:hypothetical protein